ncbi:hypothetical protein NPIL_469671 [Nephila pilipes]|uniref:Uncharacterized protein n=1 Tax=Nephila pilipes TaxID=299642 RepID=A0A8X6THU1_NEPPI|nr:hypothetical protein NPIL_469671 [Nephila pilipes]
MRKDVRRFLRPNSSQTKTYKWGLTARQHSRGISEKHFNLERNKLLKNVFHFRATLVDQDKVLGKQHLMVALFTYYPYFKNSRRVFEDIRVQGSNPYSYKVVRIRIANECMEVSAQMLSSLTAIQSVLDFNIPPTGYKGTSIQLSGHYDCEYSILKEKSIFLYSRKAL